MLLSLSYYVQFQMNPKITLSSVVNYFSSHRL